MENQVKNNIDEFVKASLKCYGKEIGLYSGEFFTLDYTPSDNDENEVKYIAQYGFPQSGCVFLNFSYINGTNQFVVTDVSIYAPEDDKEMLSADDKQDMSDVSNTVERVGIKEIAGSNNAMSLLKIALEDLQNAKIIGDCRLAVPEGSDRVPCVDAQKIEEEFGSR